MQERRQRTSYLNYYDLSAYKLRYKTLFLINLYLFTVKFDSCLQGATIERLYIYLCQYQ